MGASSYRELAKEVLERWQQQQQADRGGRGPRRVRLPGIAELLRPVPAGLPVPTQRPACGRETHTQKITVYLSADELLDLEQGRLTLRRRRETAPGR